MQSALTTYFTGEREGGLLVALVGAGLLAVAALLVGRGDLRPFAVTLGIWGFLALSVGVGLTLKTPAQVAGLLNQLGTDAQAFFAAEAPRMARVQRNFEILERIWFLFILVGAWVALRWKTHATVNGIALGILVGASVVLAFDIIAERRGAVYLKALEQERAALAAR
ncbi:MAG: hypothetical protein ACKVPX_09270 [Myxococcaceae bacterium]